MGLAYLNHCNRVISSPNGSGAKGSNAFANHLCPSGTKRAASGFERGFESNTISFFEIVFYEPSSFCQQKKRHIVCPPGVAKAFPPELTYKWRS